MHGALAIEAQSHVCEGFVYDEQTRFFFSFPSGISWRVDAPLKLVHTNICGTFDPIILEVTSFLLQLLMTLIERYGCIFSRENLVHLIHQVFLSSSYHYNV